LSNKKILDKRQGYKYSTIPRSFEVDDTQEIEEKEKYLLRCHPFDHFPLTGETHLTVLYKPPEPSLPTKFNQAGIMIKY
jgi:hypothetical protein